MVEHLEEVLGVCPRIGDIETRELQGVICGTINALSKALKFVPSILPESLSCHMTTVPAWKQLHHNRRSTLHRMLSVWQARLKWCLLCAITVLASLPLSPALDSFKYPSYERCFLSYNTEQAETPRLQQLRDFESAGKSVGSYSAAPASTQSHGHGIYLLQFVMTHTRDTALTTKNRFSFKTSFIPAD